MSWISWVVVVWFAINAVMIHASVGKARPPLKQSTATSVSVIYVLLIILIVAVKS